MVVLTLLRSFYWVQDQSPQLGWIFLLLTLGPISIVWQCPQLGWVFPSQWDQFRNSLIDVPEVCLLSDIRSSLVDSIRYHIWKRATVVLSPSEEMSNEMTAPPPICLRYSFLCIGLYKTKGFSLGLFRVTALLLPNTQDSKPLLWGYPKDTVPVIPNLCPPPCTGISLGFVPVYIHLSLEWWRQHQARWEFYHILETSEY